MTFSLGCRYYEWRFGAYIDFKKTCMEVNVGPFYFRITVGGTNE
ncbi:hypothetical protein [Bacillus cereus]|nr:hypothetical protein [Bacillus cereus]